MTQTVGFIGSGMIGGSLARLAVAAGLDVVMSNSRGPETLAELVTELGAQARAATPQEATKAGDVVVATVPLGVYRKLPADALAEKVVIDTMNYYPQRDGRVAELDSGEIPPASSSSATWRAPVSSRRSTTWTGSACTAGPVSPAPRTAAPCP